MARVPIWDEHDPSTPTEIRDALAYSGETFGLNLNIQREMANHPQLARAFIDLAMVSYGEESTITPAQRELAYTTATVVNNCHY